MSKYLINGGKSLYGEVNIQGAKNSVLPLLSASILTSDEVVISNAPRLTDVHNMQRILNSLGANTYREGDRIIIKASELTSHEIPSHLACELRSSIFLKSA